MTRRRVPMWLRDDDSMGQVPVPPQQYNGANAKLLTLWLVLASVASGLMIYDRIWGKKR